MSQELLLVVAVVATGGVVLAVGYLLAILTEKREPDPVKIWSSLDLCPNGWPKELCCHFRGWTLDIPYWPARSTEPWSPTGQGGM